MIKLKLIIYLKNVQERRTDFVHHFRYRSAKNCQQWRERPEAADVNARFRSISRAKDCTIDEDSVKQCQLELAQHQNVHEPRQLVQCTETVRCKSQRRSLDEHGKIQQLRTTCRLHVLHEVKPRRH